MLFNSHEFLLVFLPAAIIVYAIADRYPQRTWVLILLSLVFYGYWDVRFLPLMLGSILLNWWAANYYAASKRHAVILAAIVGNLAVLGVFKYTNFFAENLAALFGIQAVHFQLALPLGISFFTFHHIMYLVDLGRGRAPTFPLDRYALYICFFPQAISGPLARWNEVIHQFGQRVFVPGWERRCAVGATFIIIGLLEKTMLADPISRAIDPIFTQALSEPVTNGRAWLAPAFVFQVFFDFGGYSDIAIGLGLIFGITLPRNFDAPFRATSILSLWQRWHMTLTRFLRDYVFQPLSHLRYGGSRHRITRMLVALVITMALCGLWHGAGWHYVLWGLLQGFGMLFAVFRRRFLPPPPLVLGWAATIGYFMFTSIVFRAETLEAAWRVYQGLATLPRGRLDGQNTFLVAVICAIALPPSHEICRVLTERPRPAIAVGLAAASVAVLTALGMDSSHVFVYFQF
jgi:alginate O-acetyltransferase complex protein AlgI